MVSNKSAASPRPSSRQEKPQSEMLPGIIGNSMQHTHDQSRPSDDSTDPQLASVLREVDAVEQRVLKQQQALKQLQSRLSAFKRDTGKGKLVSRLAALITDLKKLPAIDAAPDSAELAAALERHHRSFAESYGMSLQAEIRRLCEANQIPIRPLADGLAVGPFALAIDGTREVATLQYAKLPVAKDLPLNAPVIVKAVQEWGQRLLGLVDVRSVAAQLEEAMRVAQARLKKSSAARPEMRVELPAVFREMSFIRQGTREGRSATTYTLPRFVVELRSLVQSDENVRGERRFRLETAVLENTKDSRKSIFLPNDPAVGYGEGVFYQAIILTGA
jgi:hypothetical protein